MKTQLTRREFLKLSSVASVGLVLSACGATPTPMPASTSTPLPTVTPLPTATVMPTATNTPIPTATATPAPTATPRPPTLRSLADRLRVAFGSVGSSWDIDKPDYRDTLLNIANTIAIGGPSEVNGDRLFANVAWRDVLQKWDEVSASLSQGKIPSWIRTDFSRADITIDFAKKNGQRVLYSHLFTVADLPKPIFDSSFTNDELRKMLEFMVKAKATRYRGKVDVWSINEMVTRMLYGSAQEKSVFQRLGSDFTEVVVRWAHEADPQGKLMFNETHVEQPELSAKSSETTIELLRKYKQKGLPIDIAGIHFHEWIYDPPNLQTVRQVLRTIKDMGYDTWATEVTINISDRDPLVEGRKKRVNVAGDLLQAQAQLYKDLLSVLLDVDGGFIMWGHNDAIGDMFTNSYNLPEARAHIFDENFKPKPAYYALFEVLSQRVAQLPRATSTPTTR